MKPEIDYVVRQHCRQGMIVLAKYTDRMKMLYENPTVDKTKFIVIETDKEFCRYNEVDGKEMLWNGMPDISAVVSSNEELQKSENQKLPEVAVCECTNPPRWIEDSYCRICEKKINK